MDLFGILWLVYFGFQLASLVLSSVLKLYQVFRGKHRRYSRTLLAEEVIGGALNILALVGLWGFIHSIRYDGLLGYREFWQLLFWCLLAQLIIQPLLPKSRLLYAKGGANPTLVTWLFMALWVMPLIWSLWVYAGNLPEAYS